MKHNLWRARRKQRGKHPRRSQRASRTGKSFLVGFATVNSEGSRTSASQPAESRKWGVYYVTGMIMKLYFRVCTPWYPFFSRTHLGLGQTDIPVEKHPQGHRRQPRYSPAVAISEIASSESLLFGCSTTDPLPTHQRSHIGITSG